MAVKDLNSRNEDVAENQVDDKSDIASTKATATRRSKRLTVSRANYLEDHVLGVFHTQGSSW
jgi:hypothetical protein